ncbi:hypothetical protein BO443_110146 [Burkholderia orbicola]
MNPSCQFGGAGYSTPRERPGDPGRFVGGQSGEYIRQIATTRHHRPSAKRRTSRVDVEATGKLGQPKQQLHA